MRLARFQLNWIKVARAALRLKFWKNAIFCKRFSFIKWKSPVLQTWFLSYFLGNFVDMNFYLDHFFFKTCVVTTRLSHSHLIEIIATLLIYTPFLYFNRIKIYALLNNLWYLISTYTNLKKKSLLPFLRN